MKNKKITDDAVAAHMQTIAFLLSKKKLQDMRKLPNNSFEY